MNEVCSHRIAPSRVRTAATARGGVGRRRRLGFALACLDTSKQAKLLYEPVLLRLATTARRTSASRTAAQSTKASSIATMTASSNGSGAGGEAPANTVQVGGWTLSADLSPEAMAQVQGLISGMQNDSGPARQAVERPDGSIEFPERSDDDKAAADAAFAKLVSQHPGARELCPGVYAVPPDAVVRDAE